MSDPSSLPGVGWLDSVLAAAGILGLAVAVLLVVAATVGFLYVQTRGGRDA